MPDGELSACVRGIVPTLCVFVCVCVCMCQNSLRVRTLADRLLDRQRITPLDELI